MERAGSTMSILMRFDKASSLLTLEVVGRPGMDEFKRVAERVVAEKIDADVLWDLSKGELSHFAISQFDEFIRLRADVAKYRPGRKTAVFAPVDTEFGLARMIEGLTPEGQTPFRVFKDRQGALDWLKG